MEEKIQNQKGSVSIIAAFIVIGALILVGYLSSHSTKESTETPKPSITPQPSPSRDTHIPSPPLYRNWGSYNEDEESLKEDIRAGLDDVQWEVSRFRRNLDSMDSYEAARKLKNIEWELDDLSGEAGDLEDSDVQSYIDDVSWEARKLRRDVEDEDYFYGDSDDVDYKAKKIEWGIDDALNELDY